MKIKTSETPKCERKTQNLSMSNYNHSDFTPKQLFCVICVIGSAPPIARFHYISLSIPPSVPPPLPSLLFATHFYFTVSPFLSVYRKNCCVCVLYSGVECFLRIIIKIRADAPQYV
jgi:hypothetical protein